MAASGGINVPIVCRFVSTDQWMETHLNSSWKIAEVKLWILAKFLPTVFTSVPFLPRALSSQKRAVSPIRFASRQQLRVHKGSRSTDAYYLEDDEDEDDIDEDVYDRYKYNAPVARSSTSSSFNAPKLSITADPSSGISCDPTTYTLLSFATGQILEDHYTLSWYNIQSHELLELHVAPFVINLPRAFPDEYIQPYFEARVWALRAVHRHIDSRMEASSRWGDLDNKHSDGEEHKREKLKKRKTKLEWRERWIVVHQGLLMLCRHHNDPKPSYSSPLSSLLVIRGAEHLHSTGASSFLTSYTSPLSTTSPSCAHSPQSNNARPALGHHHSHASSSRDNSRTIVCAKFKMEKNPSHRRPNMILDPPSPIPFIPLSRAATATGGTLGSSYASGSWWKRGQKDYYHSAPGSANNSAHSSAHSSGNEGKGGKAGLDSLNTLIDDHHTMHHHPHGHHLLSDHWEDDAEASQEDGTWIVLDLLDQSVFQNFIRLLHRHAPPDTPTSFISQPISTASPPPSRVPSRATSPMSFASPTSSTATSRPSSRPPSSIGSGTTIRAEEVYPPDPVHGNFELPGIPEGPGASYPDWRLNATKRARRAGLGDVGRAMEWAMFGSEEGTTDRKREPRGRSLVRHGIGSPPEEGLLDDLDSEESDEDKPQSELEWEGWMEDVKQKWRYAKETAHSLAHPVVYDDEDHRRRGADLSDVHWDPQFSFDIPLSRTISPQLTAHSPSLLSVEPHQRHPRSLNSYASADSLLKKAIKRLESRRASPCPGSRPRSPSTELDEEDEVDYDQIGYGIEVAVDDDEEQHSSSAASSLVTSHMTYPRAHPRSQHHPENHHIHHAHSHDGHSHGSRRGTPISMAMTTITSKVSVGSPPQSQVYPSTTSLPKRPRKRSNTHIGLSPASSTSFGKFGVKLKRSGDSLRSSHSQALPQVKHSEEPHSLDDQHKHEHQRQGHGLFHIPPGKLKLSLSFAHGSGSNNRNRNNHSHSSGPHQHPDLGYGQPPSSYRNPSHDTKVSSSSLAPVSLITSNKPSPHATSPLSPFESPTFAHPEDSE